jgi:TRAP-type C4-dicarboxylate transport system permease small subunit
MDSMNPPSKQTRGLLFYAGSAGLLTMMLVESAAVIGRHIGIPLLGALEIVQAAIVPAACGAMLIATLSGAHAAVHLVSDRLPESARRRMGRAESVVAGVYFAALFAGTTWLAVEYWNSFEQTEVLHIPFRPLRALVALAAVSLALVYFHRAIRPSESR